jgi:hypothetical protein
VSEPFPTFSFGLHMVEIRAPGALERVLSVSVTVAFARVRSSNRNIKRCSRLLSR